MKESQHKHPAALSYATAPSQQRELRNTSSDDYFFFSLIVWALTMGVHTDTRAVWILKKWNSKTAVRYNAETTPGAGDLTAPSSTNAHARCEGFSVGPVTFCPWLLLLPLPLRLPLKAGGYPLSAPRPGGG